MPGDDDAKRAMFDRDEVVVKRRLRPKDAATLVLVRRDADAPRVLMGRRHGSMAFMANKTVFPGGRVDACDYRIGIGGEYRPQVAARLAGAGSAARALGLAAIRETFEETGVLVGERTDLPLRVRSAWSRFLAHGVVPKLDQLDYIARAITPPNRPRRFDARFFMADASAIAHTLDAAHSEELLTPCWLTFAEARALDLPSITRIVLEEAEARLDGSSADRPIPFYSVVRGKPHVEYL
jgi:8-oxo-dGTP pyrophosphatase MutT (NUDIX family)